MSCAQSYHVHTLPVCCCRIVNWKTIVALVHSLTPNHSCMHNTAKDTTMIKLTLPWPGKVDVLIYVHTYIKAAFLIWILMDRFCDCWMSHQVQMFFMNHILENEKKKSKQIMGQSKLTKICYQNNNFSIEVWRVNLVIVISLNTT